MSLWSSWICGGHSLSCDFHGGVHGACNRSIKNTTSKPLLYHSFFLELSSASAIILSWRKRTYCIHFKKGVREIVDTTKRIPGYLKFLIKLDQRGNHMLVQMFIVLMFQTCAHAIFTRTLETRYNGINMLSFGRGLPFMVHNLTLALRHNLFWNRCMYIQNIASWRKQAVFSDEQKWG